MTLYVYDENFTLRGQVKNWISLSWTEEYRGEGAFSLVVYDTDEYAALLQSGRYLYCPDRPAAMLAVKIERKTEENTITVCGYTALHLLNRRIIDLKHEGTNIEQTVYDLINGDLRGLTQIATAEPKGLPEEFESETEGVEMLSGVFSVLNESTYGIRANFDYRNKRNLVEVYEGRDKRYSPETGGAVFSQEFGNLRSLDVTEDDDLYKNVAYITGATNTDSRPIYIQYIPEELQGKKELWRELIVQGENQGEDESDEAWRKKQKQLGIKALQEHRNALSFAVDVSPGEFGKKYELGDKVTCKSRRYGMQFDTQIMAYKYTDKSGKKTEKMVLGDRPLDYVRSSIVKSGSAASARPVVGGGGTGGTAQMAQKLAAARTIELEGEAIGETLFDGSQDVSIYVSIERLTNEELKEMLK